MTKKPGLTTIKTLFARSCNRCAFPGCDLRLTDPSWGGVKADIAHIRGEKPGSARYAPEMTDDDRNTVDNLMVMCPNHHREIDRLSPADWPADRLMQLKLEHEQRCENPNWANDVQLEHVASLMITSMFEEDSPTRPPQPTSRPPRVVIRPGTGDSFDAANVSEDADAYEVQVANIADPPHSGALRLTDGVVAKRLSPGASARAGLYGATMGGGNTPILALSWKDSEGNEYDAEYPL